jgi:hypothetical protein
MHSGTSFGDLSHLLQLLHYLLEIIIVVFSICANPKEYSELIGRLIN